MSGEEGESKVECDKGGRGSLTIWNGLPDVNVDPSENTPSSDTLTEVFCRTKSTWRSGSSEIPVRSAWLGSKILLRPN